MQKNLFLGCDPGVSGCFSAINREGAHLWDIRMDSSLPDIGRVLRKESKFISFAMIEKVHSSQQQGEVRAFKFGDYYGIMRGMIAICRIRHEYVTPLKWQTAMSCRTGGDKNISKSAAQQLFPNVKVIHRNADSLLLAEYARRIAIERGW